MKNCFILTFIYLINVCLYSQAKGVSSLSSGNTSALNRTYALVVGISDYQDPGIPDLRFADRDAEAFASYLRSSAGGKLDNDHLKVLINSNATMAQFANALDWLWEVCEEGDQAIIYFSGHGDVEKKSLTQPGFLLCWDAPARVYMAGGAFALPMLQEVVSTLSVQNKAKVIVITDACRSGTLAGSSVGGAQATAANLAKQYSNEIKIMSCQPNEYSIEGEQWGGGRGAFSYHLLNALYGMADNNEDLWVSLQEVGRYLEDHVSSEVAPVSQVPMTVGNRNEVLSKVDENILASIKTGASKQEIVMSSVESRGIEEDVLSKVDSSIRKLYAQFINTLKQKIFFLVPTAVGESTGACADNCYEQLIKEPQLQRLHSTMKRNYAAALQDDAQQTLNAWLKTSPEFNLGVSAKTRIPMQVFTDQVRTYPRCLDRAAELLGENHYMYSTLKARRYFFEAYLLANANRNYNPELGTKALSLFRESLKWQPEQPHVYWQMSMVFGYNFHQADSLEHYTRLAIDLYPSWIKVYTEAAFILSYKLKHQEMARVFLQQAGRIDSNSVQVLHIGAVFNFGEKKFVEAEQQLKRAISIDSSSAIIFNNLGYLYNETRRYSEAEPLFKKSIALDSMYALAWNNLGFTYGQMRRNAEAEPLFKKAISLDSVNASIWNQLGYFYLINRRFSEAEPVLKKAVALDSASTSCWNNLGGVYNMTARYGEAEVIYKKALSLDSTNASLWSNLGLAYYMTRRYAEAEPVLNNAIRLNPNYANPRRHLGMVCFKTNRPEEARQHFQKALEINPNYSPAMLAMAYLLISENKIADALGYVEQAISNGSTFEQINEDEELKSLRSQTEWKDLMQKHFPEKFKD